MNLGPTLLNVRSIIELNRSPTIQYLSYTGQIRRAGVGWAIPSLGLSTELGSAKTSWSPKQICSDGNNGPGRTQIVWFHLSATLGHWIIGPLEYSLLVHLQPAVSHKGINCCLLCLPWVVIILQSCTTGTPTIINPTLLHSLTSHEVKHGSLPKW